MNDIHRHYVNYFDELNMLVAKWGNSLAIRLPVAVTKSLQLREGDDIEVLIAVPIIVSYINYLRQVAQYRIIWSRHLVILSNVEI